METGGVDARRDDVGADPDRAHPRHEDVAPAPDDPRTLLPPADPRKLRRATPRSQPDTLVAHRLQKKRDPLFG